MFQGVIIKIWWRNGSASGFDCQWLTVRLTNQKAAGSSPVQVTFCVFLLQHNSTITLGRKISLFNFNFIIYISSSLFPVYVIQYVLILLA